MSYPVALIAYNRPEHLRQVLDALKANKPKELWIFCDSAKDDAAEPAVEEVRQIVKGLKRRKVYISSWSPHAGLGQSVLNAVTAMMNIHKAAIILEDDCVPGPQFLNYMNACLDKYRDNERVLAISGYTVQLPEAMLANHPWDCYFFPRIETWGWATWRHKWELYRRDIQQAYAEAQEKKIDLDRGGPDVPAMIDARAQGRTQSWSPGWMLAGYLNDMVCVYPTVSHIQNIGTDGSGVHCGPSERWVTAIAQTKPTRFPDDLVENEEIRRFVWEYHKTYY